MSDFKIQQLQIEKIKVKGIDIQLDYMTLCEIYESIVQPGITGFIDIQDYQGLQEVFNVFANDDFELTLKLKDATSSAMTLKFKIYRSEGNKVLPLHQYNVLRFYFCSAWMIPALAKTLSKPFKDNYIHEIVQSLIEECDGKINYIEPSSYKFESYVTPLWTPYHSIKHLLSFATNKNSIAGYLCWTDLKTGNVNVSTIDYLMKGSLGKLTGNQNLIVNPGNIVYQGRVHELTFETVYDTIRLVNTGLPKTTIYGFNFDKNTFVETNSKVTDQKNTRLGEALPIPTTFNDDPYTSYSYSSLFPQTEYSIASDDNKLMDLLNGELNNKYSMLTADIFKINVMVNPDINRRAGMLIELLYPSQAANSGSIEGHKQYKGMYLIRDIKHSFSSYVDYKQYCTLTSDGFKSFDGDVIKWS